MTASPFCSDSRTPWLRTFAMTGHPALDSRSPSFLAFQASYDTKRRSRLFWEVSRCQPPDGRPLWQRATEDPYRQGGTIDRRQEDRNSWREPNGAEACLKVVTGPVKAGHLIERVLPLFVVVARRTWSRRGSEAGQDSEQEAKRHGPENLHLRRGRDYICRSDHTQQLGCEAQQSCGKTSTPKNLLLENHPNAGSGGSDQFCGPRPQDMSLSTRLSVMAVGVNWTLRLPSPTYRNYGVRARKAMLCALHFRVFLQTERWRTINAGSVSFVFTNDQQGCCCPNGPPGLVLSFLHFGTAKKKSAWSSVLGSV